MLEINYIKNIFRKMGFSLKNGEKNTWYKLINHGYFNEIFASIQILKQSINLKNKMISLQELEKIKMVLENLMEDECYNFNRIF